MATKNKPTVVITSANIWSCFQWFLLGFYELRKRGQIDFRLRVPLSDRVFSNRYTAKAGEILHLKRENDCNLRGYVLYPSGIKKYFCIDPADSPYLFHAKDLQDVSCYFKMQCPKDLEKEYFPLTKEVHIPWVDHAHKDDTLKSYEAVGERKICAAFTENRHKIRPLMVGPRRLNAGISYFELKRGYQNYIRGRNIPKTKKLMCYFGSAKGPVPEVGVTNPDYNWERDIMGYYGDKISHPNEKRAIVAKIIESLGPDYDARVINNGNSDAGRNRDMALYIPLKDFCAHVAQFQYNYNVSGYRRSIPNRFIDSFIVGTGIVTDKLEVKWYLPFDKEEVVETVEMGYLKNTDVDWNTCEKDLRNLPESDPAKIIACFEEKWAPAKVAEYMLQEIENS